MTTIINVQSFNHLGDNIINFIFFYQIKEYIESNNIIIHYRCHEQYHQNLSEMNCSKNIIILPWEDIGYVLWQRTVYEICKPGFSIEHILSCFSIEHILCLMFNVFLQNHNIPVQVEKFEYKDDDLLKRYYNLDDKYKNIDILIINSTPLSGQINYVRNEWNQFIINLSKKYKIVTSETVNEDILSAQHLSVKDVAAIGTNVKNIIAIHTGPSIPLHNTDILNNVENIYMFNDYSIFSTRKIKKTQHISELSFLLDA